MTETFEELLETHKDRGVTIWIEGEPNGPSTKTAKHITNQITPDENKFVHAKDANELTEGDTMVICITSDARKPADQYQTTTIPYGTNTVCHAPQLPFLLQKLIDVHITTTDTGDINDVYKLALNDYDSTLIKTPLEYNHG